MTDAACITAEGLNLHSALVHSKHEMKLGPNVEVNCAYFYTAVLLYQFWHLFDLAWPLRCERATTYTESVFLDGHSSAPTTTAAFYKVMQFIHPWGLLPHVLTSCRRCCWPSRHTPTLTRKPTNHPLHPWNPVVHHTRPEEVELPWTGHAAHHRLSASACLCGVGRQPSA